MNPLILWAHQWGVSAEALADLRRVMCGLDTVPSASQGGLEAAVSSRIRLEASKRGWRLWRNNVGAGYAEDGSFMRWGLANDSAALNKVVKSHDLIGIHPVRITPAMVGSTIGQFASIEAKRADWKWSGSKHEVAQMNWGNLITVLGGYSTFATSPDQVQW